MQNTNANSTADWLTLSLGYLRLLPNMVISSTTQYLGLRIFQLLNFLLQSILFSNSVLNVLSCLVVMVGLTQASTVISNRYVYTAIGVVFASLHIWEFSDHHQYLHELLSFVSGFYLSMCAVEGCAYVKDKLDGRDQRMSLYSQHVGAGVGHPSVQSMHNKWIINQLLLIVITLFSSFFFIFIWYHVKVSKQVPYLANNYITLAALLVSTVLVYAVCLAKRVSLFLPALVCCLLIYLTLVVRIVLDLQVYPTSQELSALCFPFESLLVLLFGMEGKQQHIRQSNNAIAREYASYDAEVVQQKLKSGRMLINNMFWGATAYYLYSVTHGNIVHIQYMVVPVFTILLLGGHVH